MSPAEDAELRGYAVEHVDYLVSLYEHPALQANNHGFMDAMAVFDASLAFADEYGAEAWNVGALARLNQLFDDMIFETEGFSVEQSFGYHYYMLRLFDDAQNYVLQTGHSGIDAYQKRIESGLEVAALFRFGDGAIPAIGDTPFGMLFQSANFRYTPKTTTPYAQFVITNGAAGELPPDLLVYPAAGYAIFRPNYGFGGVAPANDARVIFDFFWSSRSSWAR